MSLVGITWLGTWVVAGLWAVVLYRTRRAWWWGPGLVGAAALNAGGAAGLGVLIEGVTWTEGLECIGTACRSVLSDDARRACYQATVRCVGEAPGLLEAPEVLAIFTTFFLLAWYGVVAFAAHLIRPAWPPGGVEPS